MPASTSAGSGTGPADRVVLELAGHRDQLGEVLHPGLVLRVVGRLELGEVAGAVEHRLEDTSAGRSPASTIDRSSSIRSDEALDRVSDRVASPGVLARCSASQKVIRSRSASASTQASARSPMPRLGHVEDAAQRDRVGRVGQHRR
jgi:hypothetical protein